MNLINSMSRNAEVSPQYGLGSVLSGLSEEEAMAYLNDPSNASTITNAAASEGAQGLGDLDLAVSKPGEGFLGTGMSGMEATKIGLGVGQLGLGLASYLDNKKTAKKQRSLLDQQIANNADLMKRRTDRSANISKYFG